MKKENKIISNDIGGTGKNIELFDVAPIGYCWLSKEGKILEINQYGQRLLGKERNVILNTNFGSFVSDGTKPAFNLFLENLDACTTRETCEVTLLIKNKPKVFVHLTGICYGNSEQVIIIILDITERKLAEEALQASEDGWRSLIENVDEVFIRYDLDARIQYVSPRISKFLTINPKDLIGKTHSEAGFFSKEQTEFFENSVNKVFESGENLDIEFDILGKEGILSVESRLYPEIDPKGNIIAVVSVTRNVTGRKQTEQALKESEALFSITFHGNPTAISISDFTNDKWVIANEAFLKVTGYSHEEIIGHTFKEINLWKNLEDRDKMRKMLDEQGHVSDFVVNINKKNGETGIMQLYVETVVLSGKPYLLIMGNDITARNKAEADLHFRNLILSTQQEASMDGILVVDENNRILSYNQRFVDVWGIPLKLVENKIDEPVLQFVAEQIADPQVFLKQVYYLYEFRQETSQDELILKNGHVIERYSAPMFGPDGHYFGRVWYFRDITDRKRAENELIQAKDKAEENDHLKTAFLQNISHEIRTPMNSIIGFSKLLDKPELLEEKRKNYTDIIIHSSEQLLSIVNDVLTISSLETRQEKVNIQKVNINNILRDLLSIFRLQAANQDVSLSVSHSLPDKQSEIDTDKTKIIQILTNLLTNALKFTHEGYIKFGYKVKGKNIEFYVKDSGIGINPELQEIIFDRFRQADLSISTNYGGTGLGLAISKGFVELLGGKIWVESEPGKGSVFYFTLPRKSL
jgi:PAS domain S-box-containing protein